MQPDNTLGHTSTVGRCESSRLTELAFTYAFNIYKFCNVYILARDLHFASILLGYNMLVEAHHL